MRFHDRDGFTLVELLLYIAIVAGLLLAVATVTINMLRGSARLEAIQTISQNARLGLARIELAVGNATTVTTPTFGTTSTMLVLQTGVTSTNPTMIGVSNGVLEMKEGTTASTTIMMGSVRVSNILFRNLSASSTLASIRIELAVSSTFAGVTSTLGEGEIFYGTANVRKRL